MRKKFNFLGGHFTMRTLITYSTLTGNTRKVAESIHKAVAGS